MQFARADIVNEKEQKMKLVTLTAAGALFAGAAYAGGIAPAVVEPVPMAPAPIVMPSQDWTGGYAGLSAGYAGVKLDGDADILDSILDADDDEEDGIFGGAFDVDGDGVVGGAFAGYQQDFGRFVLGGEVDLNAANLDFDDDDFFGGDVSFEDEEDAESGVSVEQLHRAKLRAGYDMGNVLVYGVAGAAHAKADVFGEDMSDMGYVLGAGVDYKVTDSVVVGAEVLHHQFDDFDDSCIDADITSLQARVAYQF